MILKDSQTPDDLLPLQGDDLGHSSGPSDAPVTLVVFTSYQCPACLNLEAVLRELRTAHAEDARFLYIHFPQAEAPLDALAIQAVEAADLQGNFWDMHDLLVQNSSQWIAMDPDEFSSWLQEQALVLGLDQETFRSDMVGVVVNERLDRAIQAAEGLSGISPPLLFINSPEPYSGVMDYYSLDAVLRLESLASRQYDQCPPRTIDPLHQYLAELLTSKGRLVIQLYPEKAPLAVANFVYLARQGWYDGTTFHKLVPGDRIVGGDPSGTGLGHPGYLFATESAGSLKFDQPGVVAMENDGPGTNGSRFFITLAAAPELDGQYTIIGIVIQGLELAAALTPRLPQPGLVLPPGDELISVTILEQ